VPLELSPLYGEVEGGQDIYPNYQHPHSHDGAPAWELIDTDHDNCGDYSVTAAPVSHGVPCVDYVIEERARPGRLRSKIIEPLAKRNIVVLKQAGFEIQMKCMAVIKHLPPSEVFTFPDGTKVRGCIHSLLLVYGMRLR